MSFIESDTYKNLVMLYEKELMFSARYELYSLIARSDGFIEYANIYDSFARQDREHARIWLRNLSQGNLPGTAETLIESAKAENNLASIEYQNAIQVARQEGYNEIVSLMAGIANINFNHELVFQQMYNNIILNQVYCKPNEILWTCIQCGNIMSGLCAPEICPVCGFPQGYYRPLNDCIY